MKRKRTTNASKAYHHDRVALPDDFEVIHSRQAATIRVSNSSRVVETPRSPQRGRTTWNLGSNWAPDDDTELALDPDGELYDLAMESQVLEEPVDDVQPVRRRPHTKTSSRPTVYWKEKHRQSYLEEILRYEGRGDGRVWDKCMDCQARSEAELGNAEICCQECFSPELVCPPCA
ncbi:hypothetical protein H0H92_015595, partial [Tricholoma furcatifolium]